MYRRVSCPECDHELVARFEAKGDRNCFVICPIEVSAAAGVASAPLYVTNLRRRTMDNWAPVWCIGCGFKATAADAIEVVSDSAAEPARA